MKMKTALVLAGLASLVVLNSCKEAAPLTEVAPINQLESVLLTELPAGALSVADAFANPTPGTSITITGKVMGRMEPFIENRAMVVLGDPSKITPCNRKHDDGCQTPWDVCCDDPEVIKKSVATIQILGENGRPLKQGLKGLSGIQELTTLTVLGEIAEGSNAENLLINASGIHVGATDPFMAKQ